jgi:hypothetical protein
MTPSDSTTEKRPFGYPRPYPRDCVVCARREVYPETITLEIEQRYQGQVYPLVLENFSMPVCRACGERIYTEDADREINDRFRDHLRLLRPEQIREGIEAIATTPQELGERLGISEEQISRYLRGWDLQPRGIDNLMRVYFASAEVRELLRGKDQDPNLGVVRVRPSNAAPVRTEPASDQAKI